MARKKMNLKLKTGTFTAAAKRAGMSVPAFTAHVLKKGSRSTALMKKKAVFARNAKSWKH
jgi:hypothetical protein